MAETGVSKSVMLCYVPTTVMFERGSRQLPEDPKERPGAIRDLRERIAGRVVRYNEWACETGKEHPNLLPFVGPDPFIMDKDFMVNELEDKLKKGAKGVKIVPQVLGIYLSDPRLWPIYDFCNRTGLPLLTQSGQGAGPVPPGDGFDSWGRPIHLKYALEEFKNLKVILGLKLLLRKRLPHKILLSLERGFSSVVGFYECLQSSFSRSSFYGVAVYY